ncbi:hypothetical protein [Maribacter sp. 2307ULW6-5]|uniref:hypothetical protein n=1 Tax=Maribacter sp. 2307ULW6-5 TaxID=3386275 RepID=UPI0039BCF597
MQSTREIRWFFTENREHLAHWFRSRHQNAPAWETHTYLNTGHANLGIKLRDQRVEVKQLKGNRAKGRLANRVWGCFENYVKWSLPLEKNGFSDTIAYQEPEGWTKVKKQRWRLWLGPENGDTLLHSSAQLSSGCQLEYAVVTINDETWYSFGLEWFGPTFPHVPEPLISDMVGNVEFNTAQSKGYAAFLSKYFT